MASLIPRGNLALHNINRYSHIMFQDQFSIPVAVSSFTATTMKFVAAGSLVKFTPPAGYHYDKNNKLVVGEVSALGDKEYIWTKIISVYENGTIGNVDSTLGPIILNDEVYL